MSLSDSGLIEELATGLECLGDIRGTLKFLFTSTDAKPSFVKEQTIYK